MSLHRLEVSFYLSVEICISLFICQTFLLFKYLYLSVPLSLYVFFIYPSIFLSFCLYQLNLLICLYLCISVCLFVCLSICLYVYMLTYLPVSLPVYLCLYVCLSICLSICLSACPSICLSVYHLSICVSPYNARPNIQLSYFVVEVDRASPDLFGGSFCAQVFWRQPG